MKADCGGAARAGLRLHDGLVQAGCQSSVLVHRKTTTLPGVIAPQGIARLQADAISFLSRQTDTRAKIPDSIWGYDPCLPTPYSALLNSIAPDVINLHWLGSGFLSPMAIANLAARFPLVWTQHDMRAFTGGCHYDDGCGRHAEECGSCPKLNAPHLNDLSHRNWQKKRIAYARASFTVVTPSQWLRSEARLSSLFRDQEIEVIPYGLDLELFQNVPKQLARAELKLPAEKKLVLFGAVNSTTDHRKGFDLLREAIAWLAKSNRNQQDFFMVILGSNESYESLQLTLPGICIGPTSDNHKLAKLFAAADVFVAPSREDNLPNTVLESLGCGTPAVAFNIGGMPDMIEHLGNGFLARPFESQNLAEGITYCVKEANQLRLASQARLKAEKNYSLDLQASRYLTLYQNLIQKQDGTSTCIFK